MKLIATVFFTIPGLLVFLWSLMTWAQQVSERPDSAGWVLGTTLGAGMYGFFGLCWMLVGHLLKPKS